MAPLIYVPPRLNIPDILVRLRTVGVGFIAVLLLTWLGIVKHWEGSIMIKTKIQYMYSLCIKVQLWLVFNVNLEILG